MNITADVAESLNGSIHLCCYFALSKGLPGTQQIWTTLSTEVSSCTQLPILLSWLRDQVQQRVLRDEVMSQYLRSNQKCISLQFSLSHPIFHQGHFNLVDPLLRVDTVSDLLLNRQDPNLHCQVKLSTAEGGNVQAQNCTKDLIVDELPDASNDFQCVFLGKVPTPDDQIFSRLGVREQKRLRKPIEIEYVWPLLAWKSCTDEVWQIGRVHGYDFGDFCIGDVDEWTPWNKVRYSHRYDYALPFASLHWYGRPRAFLDRRLQEPLDCDASSMPVPFLPPYCLNRFDANPYGLGLSAWPKNDIEVAVRCVSHLAETFGRISFPRDIRLEIEESDRVSSIKRAICGEINRCDTQDDIRIDSGELFRERCLGIWEMKLWVMPQPDGPQKLFRYRHGKLTQFLSSAAKVRTGDARLYMEAHIVPRNI